MSVHPDQLYPRISTNLNDFFTPGVVVEVSPEEAEEMGCFEETAISEEDAIEANYDLPLAREWAYLNRDRSAENTTLPEEEDPVVRAFEEAIARDNGAEARKHLASGNPIYYTDGTTPPDVLIKEYPSGRKELITFDVDGQEQLIRSL